MKTGAGHVFCGVPAPPPGRLIPLPIPAVGNAARPPQPASVHPKAIMIAGIAPPRPRVALTPHAIRQSSPLLPDGPHTFVVEEALVLGHERGVELDRGGGD